MPSPSSALSDAAARRYRVESHLHSSPQADLYLAREQAGGAWVVLKRFGRDAGRAYLREAAAALGLTHPHIVRCLDTFYPPDEGGCVVYEYLAGGTLAGRLAAGPLPPEEVWRCLGELAEGLAYLHASGRIHCDLKPENVLLDDSHPPRHVLGDLGSVCFIREAREGRHTAGSPAYIAPERIYDRFFFNSDLYSLGVLGFEIATGTRPHVGTPDEVLRAHLAKPPPWERITDPALRRLLEHLLEKDPAQRLESAGALLKMLDRAESTPPSAVASPPSAVPDPVELPSPDGWRFQGVYGLPIQAGRLAAVLEGGGRVHVVLDHGSHAEILAPDSGQPSQAIGKVGGIGILGAEAFSYASSTRVFRATPGQRNATCVWDGCRNLTGHVLAEGHLFWYGRHGLNYVDLIQGRSHAFRAQGYLLPVQAAILPDGRFCYGEGMGYLVFRSPEAQPQERIALGGMILDLTQAGGRVLALVADLSYPMHWLVDCADPARPAKFPLAADVLAWSWAAGGWLVWTTKQGGLFATSPAGNTERLPIDPPPDPLGLRANGRWLALSHAGATGPQLSLWTLPSLQEPPR